MPATLTPLRHGARAGDSLAPGRPQESECRELLGMLRGMGLSLWESSYAIGKPIYPRDGDLHVITTGAVKLSRSYGWGKEAITLLGEWETFGASGKAGLLPARLEAFTDCEVVRVPGVSLERAIQRRPETALGLTTLLDHELTRYQETSVCLAPRKSEARLALLLPVLARKFSARGDEHPTIHLRLTHEELAAMVASTRESVTNALNRLRRMGVLEIEGGCITVLEPEMLTDIGRQAC